MRLGCAAYSYRESLKSGELTLEQFVDLCAALGLDGVELTSYYFPSTEPDYLHRLKRYCLRQGMHILGTAVGSNFTQADEEARREHVRMTRDWIDHSVLLGAPCLRVFAGPVPEGVEEGRAADWALECLLECVAYGAERGVAIALENHGGITTTARQVEGLLDRIDSPWFGLNLDFGNFREDPYAEIESVAARAITTHAKVTSRFGVERKPVDYARIVGIMNGVGYRGYLSVEYEEAEDARTGVPRFVQYLRDCAR